MKCIDEINLKDKYVFIRVDLNVPLDRNGAVAEDTRIRASLPTIEYACAQGAKVILASHLGRPKGEVVPGLSLKPVAHRLQEIIDAPVFFVGDCIGKSVKDQILQLKSGEIILLENVRFYSEESQNNPEFSRQLASLADVYINDAFGTAHRAHASTAGMVEYFKEKATGFGLRDEVEYFRRMYLSPEHPLVAIFGGAKISTKIRAIRNIAQKADIVIVGGAMANTFFVAQGYSVGKSLIEESEVETAKEILQSFKSSACQLLLPIDAVVAEKFEANTPSSVVPINNILDSQMVLDIGPGSAELFCQNIAQAKTVIWNGPMGAFETAGFEGGTYAVTNAVAQVDALTVAGGGDTILAIQAQDVSEQIDHISTGGGAFLQLLEGRELAAISALLSI